MRGFLFDTHIHTKETSPCGKIPAAKLVQLYKQAGYRGIVITDHFSPYGLRPDYRENWQLAMAAFCSGYKLARDKGKEVGLTVLFGLEISFRSPDKSDYLVYGAEESFLLEHNNLVDIDLPALRHLADAHDILIFQAHPFRSGMQPAAPHLLDGVEVYNGNPRHDSSNDLSLAFAEEHGLLKIAGSDAHRLEDVGRGGVYLPESPETMEEFVQLLKTGKDIRLWIRDAS